MSKLEQQIKELEQLANEKQILEVEETYDSYVRNLCHESICKVLNEEIASPKKKKKMIEAFSEFFSLDLLKLNKKNDK